MFTAVAMPTLNEAEDIDDAFYGLARQTHRPDIVIVADGGSTDGTIDAATDAADDHGLEIRIGQRDGTNIGASCEAAVLMAADEMETRGYDDAVIVRTDGDSILSDDWIRLAHDALADKDTPTVFGGLTIPKHTYDHRDVDRPPLWRRVSWWGYSALSNANPTPKGRGMAFTWSDFRDLGGYCLCDSGDCNCSPQWYEDSILTTKAKMAGQLTTSTRAHIYTEMPTTTLSSPNRWGNDVRQRVRDEDWRPDGDARYD